MLRTLACAALILAVTFTLASAEEVKGRITKVEGDKISFTVAPAAKGQKGEMKTYDAVKDVKVYKMDKKTKLDVAGGLTAPEFANLAKRGIPVTLNVNGDNKVTEITIGRTKKAAQ
ncbi:MAG TPA: hypothetical protein VHR72_09140 [Gemmataceae bacterium]|jgi:pentose-5-phosphate-3-epimerase|nr:hypothetical protein [Gemmataceae bacterium]